MGPYQELKSDVIENVTKAADETEETVAPQLDCNDEPDDNHLNEISPTTPFILKRQGSARSINKLEKEVKHVQVTS